MFKHFPFALIAGLLVASSAQAQTYETNYHRVYDASSPAKTAAVVHTQDFGYATAANHPNIVLPGGFLRPLLTRLERDFSVRWAKTYAVPTDFARTPTNVQISVNDTEETDDGGFLLAGMYVDPSVRGAFLLKIRPDGHVGWFTVYPTVDYFNAATEVIINGRPLYSAVGMIDRTIQRTAVVLNAETGGGTVCTNRIWAEKGGVRGDAELRDVVAYRNNTFASVGYANGTATDSDVLLTLTDTKCNLVEHRTYGETTATQAGGAVVGVAERGEAIARDGNSRRLFIAGSTEERCIGSCPATLYDDVLAMRLRNDLTVRFARRYDADGELDQARAVVIAPKPGQSRPSAWITGRTATTRLDPGAALGEDAFLLELNARTGGFRSFEIYGADGSDWANDVTANVDNNVVLVGGTDSYGVAQPETYLVERFESIIGACNDERYVPSITNVTLTLAKARESLSREAYQRMPLRSMDTPVHDLDICDKVLH